MEKIILGLAPCPICSTITEIRKNKNGRAYTFCSCGAEIKWPSDRLNPTKRVQGFIFTDQIKADNPSETLVEQKEKQPEEEKKYKPADEKAAAGFHKAACLANSPVAGLVEYLSEGAIQDIAVVIMGYSSVVGAGIKEKKANRMDDTETTTEDGHDVIIVEGAF